MADEFRVAEKYSDVTQSYIKASLEYQYRGKKYEFKEDLLITLESDFKKKAKNLDWLFQGQTRVRLQPDFNQVYGAVTKDKYAKDFIEIATCMGYVIEPEQFVAGYVLDSKKNTIRLSKVDIFNEDNLSKVGGLTQDTLKTYVSQELRPSTNKYRPEVTPSSYSSSNLQGVNDLFIHNNGLVVNAYPQKCIQMCWKNQGNINTEYIISLMDSTEVVLSIDINDYITCSEGGVSSCMSMNNSYHLGWMLHYRSDFSIMTFTHKKGDSFYKTGRSWTFVKLTEDGFPYSRPFYKLSKVYNALNKGHIAVVDNYIQMQATDVLGMGTPKKQFEKTEYGNNKYIVSPNMRNTSGNTQGTGYFDWYIDDNVPIWEYKGEFDVVPFSANNYKRGPICLLNFPDALDVNGAPTNEGTFRNDPQHNPQGFFGWNEHYKQFVTCKATGKRIMYRDALELNDGTFILKSLAANIISGAPVIQQDTTETIEDVKIEILELSDEDISDF